MTEPVVPAAAVRSRSSRWPVALLVTVLALGGLAAGVAVLSGRPIPEARRWVPASAALVVELRPDLPGDQRDGLGALLAHFPGFRDRSLLDRKLDETAERLVGQASGGAVSYVRDVKPWLAGPMAVAVIPAAEGGTPDWLLVATTDGTVDPSEIPFSSLGCRFAQDDQLRCGQIEVFGRAEAIAVMVRDRMAVIGTPTAVASARAAHDTGTGIHADPGYVAALEALGGDRLISVVARPTAALAALPLGDLAHAMPAWVAAGLRAEADALVADVVAAPFEIESAGALLESGPARLADRVPAGSLAFLEVHPVALDALLAPSGGPIGAEEAPPLSALTVLRSAIGWVEDAGFVVVSLDGADGPSASLLLRAADAAAAAQGAAMLRNAIGLGAAASGGQVDISVHDGTEIAATDIGPALAGLFGGQMLPGAGEALDGLRLAVAVDGDTVLVGLGEASVIALLDVDAGASLGTSTAFRSAVEAAGGSGGAIAHLDLEGLIAALVADLPDSEAERWASDLAPFAAPLRAVALTLDPDPDGPRFRIVLTVE